MDYCMLGVSGTAMLPRLTARLLTGFATTTRLHRKTSLGCAAVSAAEDGLYVVAVHDEGRPSSRQTKLACRPDV